MSNRNRQHMWYTRGHEKPAHFLHVQIEINDLHTSGLLCTSSCLDLSWWFGQSTLEMRKRAANGTVWKLDLWISEVDLHIRISIDVIMYGNVWHQPWDWTESGCLSNQSVPDILLTSFLSSTHHDSCCWTPFFAFSVLKVLNVFLDPW